jgi:hypothetical protein
MTLPLIKIQALNELSHYLYSFLPGQAHPYANQNISFAGIAKQLGLSQYWSGGSKQPAISQLLTATIEYKSGEFCKLIIEIVTKSITYRQSKGDPITREEIDRINEIIKKIGFKIPELHENEFLNSLPRKIAETDSLKISNKKISELKDVLLKLTSTNANERGFHFEKFLKELFELNNLAPHSSFRMTGEQIDGSLQFQGETYLIEAKWHNSPISQDDLLIFSGKVGGKAQWSRGLFISYSGFSLPGLEAFSTGKPTNIICMDGYDLCCILDGKIEICKVIERKVRKAAETNRAHVSVKELFPEIL